MRTRWIVAAVLIAACAGAAFAYREALRRRILGPPRPQALIGHQAPELPTLPTLDGRAVRLADHRGRVVLLLFWSYGCTLVDELLPRCEEWRRRLGPRGLAVVGVYTPEHAGETRVRQLERLGLERPSWPLALDAGLTSWPPFRVRDSPTVFLIDREGRVRAVHSGGGIADAVERDLRGLVER
jgi:cytochrome oxidase Cu insertion factor (SCO1/SenC/PrrC family)